MTNFRTKIFGNNSKGITFTQMNCSFTLYHFELDKNHNSFTCVCDIVNNNKHFIRDDIDLGCNCNSINLRFPVPTDENTEILKVNLPDNTFNEIKKIYQELVNMSERKFNELVANASIKPVTLVAKPVSNSTNPNWIYAVDVDSSILEGAISNMTGEIFRFSYPEFPAADVIAKAVFGNNTILSRKIKKEEANKLLNPLIIGDEVYSFQIKLSDIIENIKSITKHHEEAIAPCVSFETFMNNFNYFE